jgi:uncharacterized protein DUF4114
MKLNAFWGALLLPFFLNSSVSAQVSPLDCVNGFGGTVSAKGYSLEVEILPGNPGAAYTSELYLNVGGQSYSFGTSRDHGKITKLGQIAAGTELKFYIFVRNTSQTYFIGDASRNPDGVIHAIVNCLNDGRSIVAFEDLPGGGDQSYNDIRFEVRSALPCLNISPSGVVTESMSGFSGCAAGGVGSLSVKWGQFGRRTILETDAGESLELRCDPGVIPSFHLYYKRPGDVPRVVGTCPFVGGCNIGMFSHSGDRNGDGKPDCLVSTYWKSKDYHLNDNPNPWTGEEEIDPVLDHAITFYDVVNDQLVKENRKFEYRGIPPIACGQGVVAEGKSLGVVRVDPRLGPETDAFFDVVMQRLQQSGVVGISMEEDPNSPADLNMDGILDDKDLAIVNGSLGSCDGMTAFQRDADFNGDGCIR